MIYRQGIRCNIPRLRVVRCSTYVTTLFHEDEITKYRYAFEQERTGIKFVYTGTRQYLNEGDVVDLRATIKHEADKFGFARLSRIRKVNLEPELPL